MWARETRSCTLAKAYAFSRPPVHRHVGDRIALRLSRRPADRALDIGCGAGLSSAALAGLATTVIGVEPFAAMLKHAPSVAPGAAFVVGQAEALPFASGSLDLVTAAGSLNYADLPTSLANVARVLAPGGLFVPYDFSAGRRSRDDPRLSEWFEGFRRRFPSPGGYALTCPSSRTASTASSWLSTSSSTWRSR